MDKTIIYCPVRPPALTCCLQHLAPYFRLADTPDASVTHLLLPIPSFESNGQVKGGAILDDVLSLLPKNITVIGGNLVHPKLQNYRTIDLLQDPEYLAQNAKITAYCAITFASQQLEYTWDDCRVLICGWGGIGKCLGLLLQQAGAQVTVCARNPADRAMASSFGLNATPYEKVSLENYHVLFNTVPSMIFSNCKAHCLNIDLASVPGIAGDNIFSARGLPGKMTPKSSGALIAKRILTTLKSEGAVL